MRILKFLLDLALTKFVAQPNHTECLSKVIERLPESPTLLAVNSKSETLFTSLSQKINSYNRTYYLINENYCLTNLWLRVNSGLIFLSCSSEPDDLLHLIKKNRLISINMTLVVISDVRCRNESNKEIADNLLARVKKLLNPTYSIVIAFGRDVFKGKNQSLIFKNNQCEIFPQYKHDKTFYLRVTATSESTALYVEPPDINGQFQEGLEIEIIKAISYDMNLSWVEYPPGENPRLASDNGNFTGLLGVLDRLEADIAVGSLSANSERFRASEILTPHTEDSLRWLISAPATHSNHNWRAVLSGYSTLTLCMITSVLTLVSFISALDKTFKSNFKNLIILFWHYLSCKWAILLNQTVRLYPQSPIVNFLMSLYILFCLIISSAYQSSLITALTSESRIDWYETPQQLVEDGHTVYLSPSGNFLFKIATQHDPMWRAIMEPGRHKFFVDYKIVIKELVESQHGMVLCVENPCNFVILNSSLSWNFLPKVVYLKERYGVFWVSLFMAPGSPLYNKMNQRIMWLLERGLVRYWTNSIYFKYELYSAYKNRKEDIIVNEPDKLSISHFKGIFSILGLSLFLSCIIFLFEVPYKTKVVFSLKL